VDLRNRSVFDVNLGRSELSLSSYLRHLPGKENVRLIAMDLSETYRSIAKKYFPNATIVADRFHVVRLINHHFLKAWQIQHPEGRKNRGLLSLMRRHQWRLNKDNRANLDRYLANYPVLRALYITKQKLIRFVLMKTMNQNRMEKKLPQFLELLAQLHQSPLNALGKTLASWLQPIVAMWRFTHRRLPQQNGNDIEKSVWF